MFCFSLNGAAVVGAEPHGAGMVEEGLPEAALEGVCPGAVLVQVAEPVAVLHVLEVGEGPVVHHVVADGVAFLSSELVGERHGNERLVVRPPEFHVVPVFLDGLAVHVRKVEQAAVFLVPPARESPVDHVAAHLDEFRIIAAEAGFLQHEPAPLNGMAGIERAFVKVVDDGAVRAHHFHHGLELRLHEQGAEVVDAAVDPSGVEAVLVTQVLAQFLGGRQRNPAGWR